MTKEYTNFELEQMLKNLKEIIGTDTLLPAKVGYAIAKNTQALEYAVQPFLIARDKCIRKYSKDGTSVNAETDPEGFKNCTNEINAIAGEKTEVDLSTFDFSLIEDKDLPLKTVSALAFMINP